MRVIRTMADLLLDEFAVLGVGLKFVFGVRIQVPKEAGGNEQDTLGAEGGPALPPGGGEAEDDDGEGDAEGEAIVLAEAFEGMDRAGGGLGFCFGVGSGGAGAMGGHGYLPPTNPVPKSIQPVSGLSFCMT